MEIHKALEPKTVNSNVDVWKLQENQCTFPKVITMDIISEAGFYYIENASGGKREGAGWTETKKYENYDVGGWYKIKLWGKRYNSGNVMKREYSYTQFTHAEVTCVSSRQSKTIYAIEEKVQSIHIMDV